MLNEYIAYNIVKMSKKTDYYGYLIPTISINAINKQKR